MSECGCLDFPAGHRLPAKYGLGAPALRYAALGYAVLPLARGGKKPHRMLGERGGVHHATTDHTRIGEWWSLDMAANIGVACGSKSRLAVIDLDVKHGSDGPGEFWRFLSGYGLHLSTSCIPRAATPTGGTHLWLRAPAGTTTPDRPGILPGVDVKGDGGYVVAAPSMIMQVPMTRPGERGTGEIPVPYAWAHGCPHEAPDVPGWFLPWLENAVSTGTARSQPGAGDAVPDLAAAIESGVPAGSRNRAVYKLACSLYRRWGTSPAASQLVRENLRAVWEQTDHDDFGWSEVLTCDESARRFIERTTQGEDARNASFLEWMNRRGL